MLLDSIMLLLKVCKRDIVGNIILANMIAVQMRLEKLSAATIKMRRRGSRLLMADG
jgi:hypothetical protein